eukprot:CAMPEP_0197565298 /NCGR_PEP_ID=MMETSP1320-20131121/31913_1 /TAXON_ID=91990 /ORGANISM="Bolidomonas sp., Strain RCC2347" /LENGTH=42 /DNA_ID= /DNA_START= /DNA_END= /DNA_ORIENTATION=
MSATAWIPNYDTAMYFDPTAEISAPMAQIKGPAEPPDPAAAK